MSEIRIVSITPENYENVASIYNEYILQGSSTMEETLKGKDEISELITNFDDKEAVFIIQKNDFVIGFSVIRKYSIREGYRFACETSTYLTQSETGKGFGTYLKKWIIERCKELGYHHIVAKVFSSNQASINYNLKLGYEIVGVQKEIGYKNGEWVDVVIMQYLIK